MDIFKILEEAIESEKEAQLKYREAAEEAEDNEARTFFMQLVEDEKRHERVLRERLKALKLIKGLKD